MRIFRLITKKEKNISQKFILKNIIERRNNFIEKIKENQLMSMKHKKACKVLNCIENLLILIFAVSKKHDQIVLLAKSKLNSMEVLIFNVLIDSNIRLK